MPKTYCFDLDGTLCTNTEGDYEAARPFPWAVERVNALARAGHRIVIFTARGTTTSIDWRPLTERQLADWGVAYDQLILGKPYGDVYIDDKALHADAWRFGHARDLTGPGHAPARAGAVVEVGRTFGGGLQGVGDLADRLLAAAAAAGIPPAYIIADVEAAVVASTGPNRELLEPGDDVVFGVSLADVPRAAYLDTLDGAPEPELTVTCRLLSQVAGSLERFGFVQGHDIPAVAATTSDESGAWPLWRNPERGLEDALGGRVEVARSGEMLIAGLPFCVLAVVSLDGELVGDGAPGPAARAAAAGWRERTGVDVAAQLTALAGGG